MKALPAANIAPGVHSEAWERSGVTQHVHNRMECGASWDLSDIHLKRGAALLPRAALPSRDLSTLQL